MPLATSSLRSIFKTFSSFFSIASKVLKISLFLVLWGCTKGNLEKWVKTQVSQIVGAPVAWEGFTYQWTSEGIRVTATQVSVASTSREILGRRPLRIESLQVVLNIFRQVPWVRPIAIFAKGVQADFILWDSLRRNYAFFPPGKEKVAFCIPSIEVYRGEFCFYSAVAAGSVRLWITSLKGALDISPQKIGIEAAAQLEGAEVCWPEPLLPSEKTSWYLSAQWDKKQRTLEIYKSHWHGTQAQFVFQGKIQNWKVPALYFSGRIPFRGGMLEGHAHWTGKIPDFQGRWRRENLSLTGCAELPYVEFLLQDSAFSLRAQGNYPTLKASWIYPAIGLRGEGILHLSDTSFVGRVNLPAQKFMGYGKLKRHTGTLTAQWNTLPLSLKYHFTPHERHVWVEVDSMDARRLPKTWGSSPWQWHYQVGKVLFRPGWWAENVTGTFQNGKGFLTGFLHIPWGKGSAWLQIDSILHLQTLLCQAEDTFIQVHAEGTLQEARFEGISRLGEAFITFQVRAESLEKRLFFSNLNLVLPDGSHIIARGAVRGDTVDGNLEAYIQLGEFLRYFPISNLAQGQGNLVALLCILQPWTTLTSQNLTEGSLWILEGNGRILPRDFSLSQVNLFISYDPDKTELWYGEGQIGNTFLRSSGLLAGALPFLYRGRTLRGKVWLEADTVDLDFLWRLPRKPKELRVALPEGMELTFSGHAQEVRLRGRKIHNPYLSGALKANLFYIDTLKAKYAQGNLYLKGILDLSDSSCFFARGEYRVDSVRLEDLLTDVNFLGLKILKDYLPRGLLFARGSLNIGFSPALHLRESNWVASMAVRQGKIPYLPSWLWIRPWVKKQFLHEVPFFIYAPYIEAQRGQIRLPRMYLLSRVTSLELQGVHNLNGEFLYRIRGVRVRRKYQKQSWVEVFPSYLVDRLEETFLIFYVEKGPRGVKWYYPYKFLLRRWVRNLFTWQK